MPSVGDVFRLTMSYDFLDQLVQNVYHYTLTQVGSASDDTVCQDLATLFLTEVQPVIEAVQSVDIGAIGIQVQNLNNTVGDYDLQLNKATYLGEVAGEAISSLLTWSFQLEPYTKDMRWGRKSIGGLSEGSVVGNEATSGALVDLATLSITFNDTLEDLVSGAIFYPVIARIVPNSVRPFVPYAVGILQGVFKGLGTQYTRKKGRGA